MAPVLAAATRESEEAAKRICIEDGEAQGDERRLAVMYKFLLSWYTQRPVLDEETRSAMDASSVNSLSAQVQSAQFAHRLACHKHQAIVKQFHSYSHLCEKIESQIAASQDEIIECKKRLIDAKVHKKHKQEYDALAAIINQNPDRVHLKADLERARLEIENQEKEQNELIEKLERHKKRFHSFLMALATLKQDLIDEQEADRERGRGSASPGPSQANSPKPPPDSQPDDSSSIDRSVKTDNSSQNSQSNSQPEHDRNPNKGKQPADALSRSIAQEPMDTT